MRSQVPRMTRWMAAAAALLVGAGCTEPNPAFEPDPFLPGECRAGIETSEVIATFERPEKLDILLVVDSSGSVSDMQLALADAMPQFTTLVQRMNVDTRIAVAETDGSKPPQLAAPGQSAEGCEDNGVAIAESISATWGKAVACNVVQGEEGNGFDQPLRVVDGLLAQGSDDFFRSDARLLVIVFTKDDDCSSDTALSGIPRDVCPQSDDLVDVGDMVDGWIDGRVAPESIGFAVFAGPPSEAASAAGRPVCSASIGSVHAANRLFRAASRFGEFGSFHSLCTDDFSGPLTAVVTQFVGQARATFCPADTLVHEPLSVVVKRDDDQESLAVGESGFVYLGETERCPQGALRFEGEVLREVEEIAVEYCIIPTP